MLNTVDLILKAYTAVADGSKKVVMEGDQGQKVTAYQCGTIIRMLKDQIKNFDDGITIPFIKALYFWNMDFNIDIKE